MLLSSALTSSNTACGMVSLLCGLRVPLERDGAGLPVALGSFSVAARPVGRDDAFAFGFAVAFFAVFVFFTGFFVVFAICFSLLFAYTKKTCP
jgi:hypothetical protein